MLIILFALLSLLSAAPVTPFKKATPHISRQVANKCCCMTSASVASLCHNADANLYGMRQKYLKSPERETMDRRVLHSTFHSTDRPGEYFIDGEVVVVEQLKPLKPGFDKCSDVAVSREDYAKIMEMDLKELWELANEGNDGAKAIMDSIYQNECNGMSSNIAGVSWKASNGRQELQLKDTTCWNMLPCGKTAVVIKGDVEAHTSDSYTTENKYSVCYCGDRDPDVEAIDISAPSSVMANGDPQLTSVSLNGPSSAPLISQDNNPSVPPVAVIPSNNRDRNPTSRPSVLSIRPSSFPPSTSPLTFVPTISPSSKNPSANPSEALRDPSTPPSNLILRPVIDEPPPFSGETGPGNCKVAVFADYSFFAKYGEMSDTKIQEYFAEASSILQSNFEFGIVIDTDGSILGSTVTDYTDRLDSYVAAELAKEFMKTTLHLSISDYFSVIIVTTRLLASKAQGLATLGTSCTRRGFSALSVNAPWEYVTGVIAHEIGHNMGAEHDPEACGDDYIMDEGVGDLELDSFSECSRKKIKQTMKPKKIFKRIFLTAMLRSSFRRLSSAVERSLTNEPLGTFANQSSGILPRLPIPSIRETGEKYLSSIKPLVKDNEEFEAVKSHVERFMLPGGLGERLQSKLVEYGDGQKYNWLEELWLDKAYLSYRDPLLINVNWWCQFIDHPKHDRLILKKPPPKGVFTEFQIARAAGLVTNFLNFKQFLDDETLPPDYIHDTPLCMNQYRSQFGTCRVPGLKKDSIVSTSHAHHIIVMMKNQFYKLDVITRGGERVSNRELERRLFAIGQDCLSSSPEPSVGLLTAGNRDNWADAYGILCRDSRNAANFKVIHDSILVLCLDDNSAGSKLDKSHRQLFHNENAENRWFDKTIQLIVSNSGMAGVNGEHSPADAVIPGRMFDFVVQNEPAVDPPSCNPDASLNPAERLKWNIEKSVIDPYIKAAQATALSLIKDTESVTLHQKIYGSRYIKEVAKTSPDSFIQMVLQLAWFRMHKNPTAVYESSSTRGFLHARTETGRSLSQESLAFVKSFDNDDVLYDVKRSLFESAVKSHKAYMKSASLGKGIDRHLLGLETMLYEERTSGAEITGDEMFSDEVYSKSRSFGLSTSNMSPGTRFYGGFGPGTKSGYGVNYAIGRDEIRLSISSCLSGEGSDSFEFRRTIERSLVDMMILFPKRSSVWGMNWRKDQEQEAKENTYMDSMRKASEIYDKRRDDLMRKYVHGDDWKRK